MKISLPSPTQGSLSQFSQANCASQSPGSQGLLSPLDDAAGTRRSLDTTGETYVVTRGRRSASVGTLPSLDQIRDWSLRRHGGPGDLSADYGKPSHAQETPLASPTLSPVPSHNLRPPVIQIVGATPPKPLPCSDRLLKLKVILQGTIRAGARHKAVSLPSSPVKEAFTSGSSTPSDYQERSHCARKMVNVLERRKSVSLVR